jgi:hypothetical protein
MPSSIIAKVMEENNWDEHKAICEILKSANIPLTKKNIAQMSGKPTTYKTKSKKNELS